jgi:hypothetical protein
VRALKSNCRFLVEGAFEVATFLLQQGVTSRCARRLSLQVLTSHSMRAVRW